MDLKLAAKKFTINYCQRLFCVFYRDIEYFLLKKIRLFSPSFMDLSFYVPTLPQNKLFLYYALTN